MSNPEILHLSYDIYDIASVDSKDDPNPEESISTLQKKIRQLNTARLQDKQKMDSLTHDNELLKLEIEEKERTCLKLHKEVNLLEQKLFSEKLKSETKNAEKSQEKIASNTSIRQIPIDRRAISMSNANLIVPKSMLSGDHSAKIGKEDEEIVLRLSEEVKYLKKQHQQLAQKLNVADRDLWETNNSLMDQKNKNKKLENEINAQRDMISRLNKTAENNTKLTKEVENAKIRIQDLEKTIYVLEKNNRDLNQLLLSKNQNINDLEELTTLTKNQLNEFSAALAKQIEEKQRIQKNCQMFRLRRMGNLGSLVVIPTLLIIRRDLQSNYIIELENYFSKIILNAREIMELSICKENRNKFYLVYRIPNEEGAISEKEEFESEDSANEVCKAIKEFLERANFYEKQLRDEEKKNFHSVNRKGFLSELASFFS